MMNNKIWFVLLIVLLAVPLATAEMPIVTIDTPISEFTTTYISINVTGDLDMMGSHIFNATWVNASYFNGTFFGDGTGLTGVSASWTYADYFDQNLNTTDTVIFADISSNDWSNVTITTNQFNYSTYNATYAAYNNNKVNKSGDNMTGALNLHGYDTGDALNSEFDLRVGNNYGAMTLGYAEIFVSNLSVVGMDLNGTLISRMPPAHGTSDIEFAWATSDNLIRFAIPVADKDFATYNPRSFMIGGDLGQAFNNSIINCSAQGYENIDCNTNGTGADLGVQDDLEVQGTGYFGNLSSNDWTNITIIESQITDLTHTVDTTIGNCSGDQSCNAIVYVGDANETLIAWQNITNIPTCAGTDKLTFDGTTLSCDTDASAGFTYADFFDQNLNTTDSVVFADISSNDWTNVSITTNQFNYSTYNATYVSNNDSMKGYCDAQDLIYNNTVNGIIAVVQLNVSANNISMKGYVDAQDLIFNNTMNGMFPIVHDNMTASNSSMKGYVDAQDVAYNNTMNGMFPIVHDNMTASNDSMKGYVDSISSDTIPNQETNTTSNVTFVNSTATQFILSQDTNHIITDNATCIIITGDTSTLYIC